MDNFVQLINCSYKFLINYPGDAVSSSNIKNESFPILFNIP